MKPRSAASQKAGAYAPADCHWFDWALGAVLRIKWPLEAALKERRECRSRPLSTALRSDDVQLEASNLVTLNLDSTPGTNGHH